MPDEFQQPLNENSLRQALLNALPREELLSVEELTEGLFNNTYKVITDANDYVLKVSPHDKAVIFYNERHLMQREMSISKSLGNASPLIPEYYQSFEIDGRHCFLQAYVDGRLWHSELEILSPQENEKLWFQLGVFANSLHQKRGTEFGYPAPRKAHSTWAEFIVDNVDGLICDCKEYDVYYPEVKEFRNHLARSISVLDEVQSPRLVHGDLWPRNVIIDGVGKDIHIKAVIDGERAYWGDPISDWVLILYPLPDAFWAGYGENLLENTHPTLIALYRGMYFIVNILEACREKADKTTHRNNLSEINKRLSRCDL